MKSDINDDSQLSDMDKTRREISAMYFAVISVFIVLSNFGTVCVVRMKKRKKPTDHLLRTLAVADMVTPFLQFTLGIIYNLTGVWIGDRISCSLVVFISLFLFRFSMLLSTMIAVDRFLAIAKPFIYRATIRLRHIKVTLTISGCYSIFIALLPVIDVMSSSDKANWWMCIYHWKTSRSDRLTRVHVITNSIDSMICVLIVTICNIGVIIYFIQRTRKNGKTGISKNTKDSNKSGRKSDLKYAKVMCVVALYFPICIVPTQVLIILHHFNLTSISAETTSLYQMHIVAVSLLCNPIFNAFIRKHYRHAYVFILHHPMVLCGRTQSNGGFDFDAENVENTDIDRKMNLRKLAVVSLAAARFRQNVVERKKSKIKVKNDCKPSRIVPTIVNENVATPNSTAIHTIISHLDEISESEPSTSSLRPKTSTTTYFSDQESLPPSPCFLSSPRPRVESYGSEITEYSELDLNSPQSLAFDYDVFGPEMTTSWQTYLPVPKERYLSRKRTESDISTITIDSEYDTSSSHIDDTSSDILEHKPEISHHPPCLYPVPLPKILSKPVSDTQTEKLNLSLQTNVSSSQDPPSSQCFQPRVKFRRRPRTVSDSCLPSKNNDSLDSET